MYKISALITRKTEQQEKSVGGQPTFSATVNSGSNNKQDDKAMIH